MNHRVVVTGVGVVAPNGVGKEAFWQALTTGLSGVRSIRRFDPAALATRIAGEVVDLDPNSYFEPHELKRVDRSNVLAMAASLEALKDSGLAITPMSAERIGSSIGNAVCGIEFAQKESDVIYGRGPRWGSPYLAIAFFPCGSNGLVSIRLGMKGPVLTFCNGNTSGLDAIGMAYRLIRAGRAVAMLAGGTEAPLIPLFVGSMSQDGWLSHQNGSPEKASRPFDQQADGMVLGEGSGIIVLENAEHAKARGARIYGELSGYASVSSAHDIFRPEPNGLGIVRTMKQVLHEAAISPQEVDFVNAQGFSLPDYDRMEARCIREAFADPDHRPHVSALSSWTGNTLGASGGLQAVESVLALKNQRLPLHGPIQNPDPDFPLPLVSRQTVPGPIRVVIQNAFCFMGKAGTLLFNAYEEGRS